MLQLFKQFAHGKITPVRKNPTNVQVIFKFNFKFFCLEHHKDGSIELWARSKNRAVSRDLYLGKKYGGEVERNPDIFAEDWKMRHGADRLFAYAVTGKLPRSEF